MDYIYHRHRKVSVTGDLHLDSAQNKTNISNTCISVDNQWLMSVDPV